VGSPPSFTDVLVAPPRGLKPPLMEAQAPVVVCSDLGSRLPLGGDACLIEALRSLAMDFLAKVRAKVDRVLFFGLGLKINASRDIRKRMGRVFSRLGLKPKLKPLWWFALTWGVVFLWVAVPARWRR
jgi:hypothetical protein